MSIRALIAEDEPILAAVLAASLQRLWPELEIAGTAPNGIAAVEQALALRPDILFFDIKMPGQSGLEAAEELAERWDGGTPFPHVVFVTAYDEYAVQAFEQAAADYVLKPVSDTRLARTVERLRALCASRAADGGLAGLVGQLQALLPAQLTAQLTAQLPAQLPEQSRPRTQERLTTIRAAVGNLVRMIPVDEVVFFQALDKYVNVATADSEALIRLPLKELLPQLDPACFQQVSRSTVVNLRCVAHAGRDTAGKVVLGLRNRPEKLRVSPVYAHNFRQM